MDVNWAYCGVISQRVQVSNHDVVHLKLIHLYVHCISVKLGRGGALKSIVSTGRIASFVSWAVRVVVMGCTRGSAGREPTASWSQSYQQALPACRALPRVLHACASRRGQHLLPGAPRLPWARLGRKRKLGEGGSTAGRAPKEASWCSSPLLGTEWAGGGLEGTLGPPGRDAAAPRCSPTAPAGGLAAGTLIHCRRALGCSLPLPVPGSEPRWNAGGRCGAGLPTLPELLTTSWGGRVGA